MVGTVIVLSKSQLLMYFVSLYKIYAVNNLSIYICMYIF